MCQKVKQEYAVVTMGIRVTKHLKDFKKSPDAGSNLGRAKNSPDSQFKSTQRLTVAQK